MKESIKAALYGTLLGLGFFAIGVIILWPSIIQKVVGDVNTQVKTQGVIPDVVNQALSALK